jgi:hypothetical protein
MAQSPTGTKPKRTQGPRTVKDKVVFLVSPEDITNLQVCNTAEEAMEVMMGNPGWKAKKHVIPVKRRAASNQAPATA